MELPNTKDFQWKSLAPLPSRRVYSTLVEAGGQVFAVGGCDDNGVAVDSFEVYSPEADQWAALPAMPTARAGVAVTVLGKRIMVIGGVGANQLPLKVVEMYNTDEGRWRKRSSLREAAMGISVAAKDYRVYAAGGMGADLRPHNFLQHYDVLKDIWVSLAAMPTPRYAATSILRGTKIYVLGGRQSKYAVNAFEVFDTDTRSWSRFPNIPTKRAFSSFVPTEEKLFSLGGLRQGRLYRQPKFMRTVDVFDLEQVRITECNGKTSKGKPQSQGTWIQQWDNRGQTQPSHGVLSPQGDEAKLPFQRQGLRGGGCLSRGG
ncbi:kelch domain-containing protein 8A isoform X3 [Agelaius phoeniceus]|uniref:kelch domain-containing protein 8A isoform X3 n=1 Tax=Agelaius phoeniceus TaxID=39638 RepID=UPI004054A212